MRRIALKLNIWLMELEAILIIIRVGVIRVIYFDADFAGLVS